MHSASLCGQFGPERSEGAPGLYPTNGSLSISYPKREEKKEEKEKKEKDQKDKKKEKGKKKKQKGKKEEDKEEDKKKDKRRKEDKLFQLEGTYHI